MRIPAPVRRRAGIAMFVVMGVFVVLFLMAVGVTTLTRQEGRLTGAFVEGQIAFQIAESGLEQGIFLIKKDLKANRALARAMVQIEPVDLDFEPARMRELGALAPPGGRVDARVWGRYVPDREVGSTGRLGYMELHSRGTYHTPQGLRAVRQVKAVYRVTGEDLSPVAPEHGLMIRDPRAQEYYVSNLALDARDLEVYGGKVHVGGGMGVELTEYLINKEFRPMGELGLLDLGYDSWNLFTLFNGGVNFTHSEQLDYARPGAKLTRKYFDFQGFDDLFGPGQAWVAREEQYVPQVRGMPANYDNDAINLKSAEDYKRLASVVIEPKTPWNPDGNPRQEQLFRDVTFNGPLGLRNTTYPRVLPLYGWGDWRRLTGLPYSNRTRRNDLSAAVPMDGIMFVRGDVFLEGWYDGVGTLVVQGNVFVGGDVIGLPPTVTGYQSFMNVVVLEDPGREPTTAPFRRKTGKIVYRPHHDSDFDSRGVLQGRDLDPFLDLAVYAQNGLETDRASIFDQFFNMQIEFNLATDMFEWGRTPNDLRINGTDPEQLFEPDPAVRRFGVSPFFVPQISTDLVRWEDETPSPDRAPADGEGPTPTPNPEQPPTD